MSTTLKVGQKAPDFEAETYEGEKIKLSYYRNKKSVALYFYPKDNTNTVPKKLVQCGMEWTTWKSIAFRFWV